MNFNFFPTISRNPCRVMSCKTCSKLLFGQCLCRTAGRLASQCSKTLDQNRLQPSLQGQAFNLSLFNYLTVNNFLVGKTDRTCSSSSFFHNISQASVLLKEKVRTESRSQACETNCCHSNHAAANKRKQQHKRK